MWEDAPVYVCTWRTEEGCQVSFSIPLQLLLFRHVLSLNLGLNSFLGYSGNHQVPEANLLLTL